MSEPLRHLAAATGSEVVDAARRANDRIAAKASRLRFRARIPFVCECADPDCREFVLLDLGDFDVARRDGTPVTLPEHV